MTEEKQIEEITKHCHFYYDGNCTLCEELWVECDNKCDMCEFAKRLYNAGYRKASDVARDIFEEIDKRLDDITIVMGRLDSLRTFHKTMEKVTAEVDELKKKYIGEDINFPTNTEGK
jgi:tetrahydromethanopterin S-methyltransferase subunit G